MADACGGRAIRSHVRRAVALHAAGWLSLAAAPTFAIMALLTAVSGGGPTDILCAPGANGLAPGGMVPMYVLMSAFHSAPWLRLISNRSNSIGHTMRR